MAETALPSPESDTVLDPVDLWAASMVIVLLTRLPMRILYRTQSKTVVNPAAMAKTKILAKLNTMANISLPIGRSKASISRSRSTSISLSASKTATRGASANCTRGVRSSGLLGGKEKSFHGASWLGRGDAMGEMSDSAVSGVCTSLRALTAAGVFGLNVGRTGVNVKLLFRNPPEPEPGVPGVEASSSDPLLDDRPRERARCNELPEPERRVRFGGGIARERRNEDIAERSRGDRSGSNAVARPSFSRYLFVSRWSPE